MKMKFRLLFIITSTLAVAAFICPACHQAHTPKSTQTPKSASLFKITIDRKISGPNCTQGYVLINGKAIGYTLELPDLNNNDYISSIPKDTYDAFIRTDGHLGWRIELLDVPNRTNIQIHIGNFTSNSLGCILVGKNVSLNNCTVSPSIIKELENEFNAFTRDLVLNNDNPQPVSIQVEISGI